MVQTTYKKDPYASMFGAGTDQDLRLSLELAYLQNKEKLANLKASLQ